MYLIGILVPKARWKVGGPGRLSYVFPKKYKTDMLYKMSFAFNTYKKTDNPFWKDAAGAVMNILEVRKPKFYEKLYHLHNGLTQKSPFNTLGKSGYVYKNLKVENLDGLNRNRLNLH